jgi:hypothetical protein
VAVGRYQPGRDDHGLHVEMRLKPYSAGHMTNITSAVNPALAHDASNHPPRGNEHVCERQRRLGR